MFNKIVKKYCLSLFIIAIVTGASSAFAQSGEDLGTLDLETSVQGNKELPKILYIIPWATPPGPGQVDPLVPHSANVFERTFTPLERLEQQRRLRYYSDDLLSKD